MTDTDLTPDEREAVDLWRRAGGDWSRQEHEPVYVAQPCPAYESRCSCGRAFVGTTPSDSSAALARHRQRH